MSELQDLVALAEKIAREAGTLLMQRPEDFRLNQKSGQHDFATQMDHASEALICERIMKARPEDGILGEEGADRASRSGYIWILDPIDGTVNYLYDLPGWCVSIAIKDPHGYAVGVVYSPRTSSIWKAARGHGAFLNDKPIQCNNPETLDKALVGTGFAYDIERRKSQAMMVSHLLPRVRDIRRFGACAVDIAMVGSGSLDAYIEVGCNEWDYAAAIVIAAEAGARVTRRPAWNGSAELVAVSGPSVHEELLDLARVGA